MTMKRFVNAIEVVSLVIALAFAAMLFVNEPEQAGTSASPGAEVYQANCASCHGADGGGGIGPQLAGSAAKQFPDIEDEIEVVTDGRSGMPAFEGDLTPDEIRQVVEYTRTDLGK